MGDREYYYSEKKWYPWAIKEEGIDIFEYHFLKREPSVKEHISYKDIYSTSLSHNQRTPKLGGRVCDTYSFNLVGTGGRVTLYIADKAIGEYGRRLKKEYDDLVYHCYLHSEDTLKFIDSYNHAVKKFTDFSNGLSIKKNYGTTQPFKSIKVDGETYNDCYCFSGQTQNEFRYCLISKKFKQLIEQKSVLTSPEDVYELFGHPDYYTSPNSPLVAYYFTNACYVSIPLDEIDFYYIDGEKQYQSIVTGGSIVQKKSSIKGAIIGGIIAGDVGAIIGSRPEISSTGISTEIREKDNRILVIRKHDGEHKTNMLGLYDDLIKILPTKDALYISVHPASDTSKQEVGQDTITELRKYKELLDDGIITEEEFTAKKKQLLGI